VYNSARSHIKDKMSSPTQTFENNIDTENTLSISKRLLWIAIGWAIQLIYLPTSSWFTSGVQPKLPIDIFPLWPVWVIPYVLCYPLWIAGFAWAAFKMSDRMFRAFALAFLVTCSVSIVIFFIYPTYVPKAELHGNGPLIFLLRLLHENAGRYNALPSGHIYITALLTFFYSLWYPRYRPLWILALVIVSFSTLFTLQHYILDIVAGLLVAALGYYAGLKWTGFSSFKSPPV
jgi:membrane-associated phospholipid phosphatase